MNRQQIMEGIARLLAHLNALRMNPDDLVRVLLRQTEVQDARSAIAFLFQHRDRTLTRSDLTPEYVLKIWEESQRNRPSTMRLMHSQSGTQLQPEEATLADSKPPQRAALASQISSQQASGAQAVRPQPAQPPPQKQALVREIGQYRLIKKLGAGAMGVVYLAQDTVLKRKVVLKMSLGELDAEERIRFKREAEAMARIQHPNVATIYAVGSAGGKPYLAMQFIDGCDLKDALAQQSWSLIQTMEKFRDIVRGVAEAHKAGIIHRDLKPANIMLFAQSGQCVVMDFGLVHSKQYADIRASQQGQPQGDLGLTATGAIMGTPAYAAMEQLLGTEVSFATDIYGLGKILYQMLTGEHLHKKMSSIPAIANEMSSGLPDRFSEAMRENEIPQTIVSMLEKCLELEQTDRFQNGAELLDAVNGVFEHFEEEKRRRELEAERRERDLQRKAEEEARKQKARQRLLVGGLTLAAIFSVIMVFIAVQASSKRRAEEKARREAVARADAEAQAAEEATARAEAESRAAREAEVRVSAEQRRNRVNVLFVQAQTKFDAANWQEARTELEAILQLDASFLPARWLYAEVLYNQLERSCTDQYRQIASRETDNQEKARALFWMLFSGLDLGGLPPDQAPAVIETIPAGFYHDLAQAYWAGHENIRELASAREGQARGETETAERHTQNAARWKQQADRLLAGLDQNHWLVNYMLGHSVRRTDPARAVRYFTASLSRNPDFPMTWFWRCAVLMESLGEYDAAIRDGQRVHVLTPGWVRGELLRARCYLYKANGFRREADAIADKDPDRARELYQQGVQDLDSAIQVTANWQSWRIRPGEDAAEIHIQRANLFHHMMVFLVLAGREQDARDYQRQARAELDRVESLGGQNLSNLTQRQLSYYRQLRQALGR